MHPKLWNPGLTPPFLQVFKFPVMMLIRFWVNHHLLDILQRPLWRVVKGRSKTYVDKVLAGKGGAGRRGGGGGALMWTCVVRAAPSLDDHMSTQMYTT